MSTYTNPIIPENAPDPEVIMDERGVYHLFATQGIVDGKWHNIQHFSSGDLIKWERRPDALVDHQKWSEGQHTWAPAVKFISGQYVMYFCGKTQRGGHGIGVAVTNSLDLPFRALEKPLIAGHPTYGDIDPYLDTKEMKLYWGSAREPIRCIQLTPSGLDLEEGAVVQHVLNPVENVPYANLHEAPEVLYIHGTVVLITSGHDAFGKTSEGRYGGSYGLMAYYLDRTINQFVGVEQLTGASDNIILKDNTEKGIVNPGHHTTVIDNEGQCWLFYHAINLNESVTINPVTREPSRQIFMDRMYFKEIDGYQVPYVERNAPSLNETVGPVV